MTQVKTFQMLVSETQGSVFWNLPIFLLLLATGLYFTARTGFFQFSHFGYAMKNTLFRAFEPSLHTGKGAVPPLHAAATSLAATIGTGNIAGVAGAVILGGPGAVFWMWAAAFLAMATKYAEILLAVKFRERNKAGEWVGGPMYYIVNGLGSRWNWLAKLFAAFAMLSSLGIGNMAQSNTIASAVFSAISSFSAPSATATGEAIIKLSIGIITSVFASLIILGGLKRIGRVTSRLVPYMSILYIFAALSVVLFHADRFVEVLKSIFICAFKPTALLGATAGITASGAFRFGISRAMFSNEVGLGSAPMAHASADTSNPSEQGLYGIFEVFVDTIVICTLTALALMLGLKEIPYGEDIGAALVTMAFSSVFGNTAGILLALCILLFAFSTIISWALYGARCCEFLLGTGAVRVFFAAYLLFIILGALIELSAAWGISDALNSLMALPNLFALLLLSGTVAEQTRRYKNTIKDKRHSSSS